MSISPPDFEHVIIQTDGPIASLVLNRPENRNAFNRQLILDIIDAAKWLDQQSHVKVVVIRGLGPSFCAGFDLRYFSSLASPEAVREVVALGEELHARIAGMRATTIAAVHGHCVGGGVVLMMACDFRYATEDTEFFLPETALGIPLAWAGIPGLVREIGGLNTTEFVLLCERINGRKAFDMGMLNTVLATEKKMLQKASETAETLATRSSIVLEITKRQISAARDSMLNRSYGFTDCHALFSALNDEESGKTRALYLSNTQKSKTTSHKPHKTPKEKK